MFLACVLARKKLVVRHHHRQPKMTPAESDREFWSRVHSGFSVCLAFRKAKRSTKNLQRCLFSPGDQRQKACNHEGPSSKGEQRREEDRTHLWITYHSVVKINNNPNKRAISWHLKEVNSFWIRRYVLLSMSNHPSCHLK